MYKRTFLDLRLSAGPCFGLRHGDSQVGGSCTLTLFRGAAGYQHGPKLSLGHGKLYVGPYGSVCFANRRLYVFVYYQVIIRLTSTPFPLFIKVRYTAQNWQSQTLFYSSGILMVLSKYSTRNMENTETIIPSTAAMAIVHCRSALWDFGNLGHIYKLDVVHLHNAAYLP